MTIEERIALIETELNQATQQVGVWRERQLMAQGALNVLRQIASENTDETPNSDSNSTAAGDGPGELAVASGNV